MAELLTMFVLREDGYGYRPATPEEIALAYNATRPKVCCSTYEQYKEKHG